MTITQISSSSSSSGREEESTSATRNGPGVLLPLPQHHAKIQKTAKASRHYVWLPMSVVNNADYMFKPGDTVEIMIDRDNASITLMLYDPAEEIEKRKDERPVEIAQKAKEILNKKKAEKRREQRRLRKLRQLGPESP